MPPQTPGEEESLMPDVDLVHDAVERLEWDERKDIDNPFNSAVSSGSDGIGCCLVDLTAFNGPTDKALAAGIPVVAYNADAKGNSRLAYIGQDLFKSGQEMGAHIASLVPSGKIGLF